MRATPTDTHEMRVSSSHAAVIALGFAALAVAAVKLLTGVSDWTAVALFAAALIVTELVQDADRIRTREPSDFEPFRIAAALQMAAAIILGPWPAALLAGGAAFGVRRLRDRSLGAVSFEAATLTLATLAGGYAFLAAGGHTGQLELLADLGPLAALALVYLTIRTTLMQVVAAHEAFQPDFAAGAGEAALGAAIALFATDHPWNLVALVPLALVVHVAYTRLARVRRETLQALETFANIVDERDPSTYRHSLRVAGYVDELARALKLPFSEIDRLRWAGRLHDLGKVAVDASLLRKPGRLDRAEWAAMRRHPRLSARLLQRFEFVSAQAHAVELHHERMDGGGYYGVGGDDLPLASHFLIVADSFDAMTTDRPYRAGLSHEAALAEIERNVGTQFHPAVAKAFVAVQRGVDPATVLSAEELAELRGASAPYRIGLTGPAELKEQPELVALGGVVLVLAGLGFAQDWLTAAGAGIAVAGLALRAMIRMQSERAAAALHRALGTGEERESVFTRLADTVARVWKHDWIALMTWDEDGLGGSIEHSRGDNAPPSAALTGLLVREAESGRNAIVAPGEELGRSGVVVALPLRRDNSALVGFLIVAAPKLPPRHVELALLDSLDEIGLALADSPELDGGAAQDAQPLETVADERDLALVRLDER